MADDWQAITALIYSYAELIDTGDFEGVAKLFEHGTLRSDRRPKPRRGSAEVLRLFHSTVALYDGRPSTKHVTTNLVIDIEAGGATAAARSYFTVLQARPELPLQIIIAGRYHDRFARTAGAWHFTERFILVDLLGDLRFHLKTGPFAQ